MKKLLIEIDIYRHDVLVYFGDLVDVEDSLHEYYDDTSVGVVMDELRVKADGRTVQLENKGTVIYMPDIPRTPSEYAVLAHEIFHVAYLVLDKAGVNCTNDSDEAYAYLIQFITEKILTFIKK